MKKIVVKLLFIAVLPVLFFSCQEKDLTVLNPDANTSVSVSSTSIVLDKDTPEVSALNITWTEPDFGYDAAPSYKILIDFENGDFTSPQTIVVGNVYEKNFTNAELNAKLLALGAKPDVSNVFAFKVLTVLSNYHSILSDSKLVTITPYASILDLSTNWGVVGSATPGSWGDANIKDVPFYATGIDGILVAYPNLKDGEIKFRENNDWTNNYGDDGNDKTLEAGGANIPVTAGSYKIVLNLNDLTYTIEKYSWGIVGSAAPNSWDGPDVKFEYNSYADDFRAICKLAAGEIKFRLNNDWAVNYGDTGVDGTLEAGGDNIAVAAGYYLVKFNLKELTYELVPTDVWGLVGSATPNSWNGPDLYFAPDYGLAEGKFYLNGAVLVDGEIKVRQNDDWGVNYGDDGNDGTLESGAANIPVTAGTYNIIVDFSVTPPTIVKYKWP